MDIVFDIQIIATLQMNVDGLICVLTRLCIILDKSWSQTILTIKNYKCHQTLLIIGFFVLTVFPSLSGFSCVNMRVCAPAADGGWCYVPL